MQVGTRDSPTLNRGNRSRSTSVTRSPPLARKVAVVLPPGPPPTTSTSASRAAVMVEASYTAGSRPGPGSRGCGFALRGCAKGSAVGNGPEVDGPLAAVAPDADGLLRRPVVHVVPVGHDAGARREVT